jgi:hypothetical protein
MAHSIKLLGQTQEFVRIAGRPNAPLPDPAIGPWLNLLHHQSKYRLPAARSGPKVWFK